MPFYLLKLPSLGTIKHGRIPGDVSNSRLWQVASQLPVTYRR